MRLCFYVYAYIRKDGTPYYIGKGSNKRAFSNNHYVVVPKDKNRIIICESNLTEIGALAIERRLIRWYGRKNIDENGILRNRLEGGDEPPSQKGKIRTKETRLKLSETHRGHIPWNKGKIGAQRAWNKGLFGKESPNYGQKRSIETRLKMSVKAFEREEKKREQICQENMLV